MPMRLVSYFCAEISAEAVEAHRVKRMGKKLTRPGTFVIGRPLEAATAEQLNALAAERLPEAGIDPGASLPCLLCHAHACAALLPACCLRCCLPWRLRCLPAMALADRVRISCALQWPAQAAAAEAVCS